MLLNIYPPSALIRQPSDVSHPSLWHSEAGARLAWFVEIGPVSYPDSLFASCGRLPYPYADRSRHVWNPSPSLTDDARVYCICVLLSFSMIIYTFEY